MMSASTMSFLGVAPAATAAGVPADPAAADGADFNAALAALAAAPAASNREPALAVATRPEGADAQTALDGEAVVALLAGMLPTTPAPKEVPAAGLPEMSAAEDPLGATAIIQAAGSLADSVPPVETEAAAAAASLSAVALPAQAAANGAARSLPAAASRASTQPQLTGAADGSDLRSPAPGRDAGQAPGSAANPPAAMPATLVSASPVVNSVLAESGAMPREAGAGARAADARAATQDLRNLMQAMAWGESAQESPPLQDLQSFIAARAQSDGAATNLPASAQPELHQPEQVVVPSPAAAALLHASPPSAVAATGNGVEQAVRSAVGTPRWAEELGNQLVLMNARGQQEGSLTLAPEHLGPLEVRISVHQNTANVWFGAQHADTRAALAEAMPRLRELFSDAGLALGHAGVSQEAPRQDRREAAPESAPLRAAAPAGERDAPAVVHRISRGLLDTYA